MPAGYKDREPIGLLFSRVGYDTNCPKRIFVRGPDQFISGRLSVSIADARGRVCWHGGLKKYGRKWNTSWAAADFTGFEKPGEYKVKLLKNEKEVLCDTGLRVGDNLLFKSCAESVAIEALKRREIFSQVKPGWYDAGQLWQEAGSHCVMIYGLCDLYMHSAGMLNTNAKKELLVRIKNGCDYLALCNDAAVKKGKGRGALAHDLARMPDSYTPNDSFLAALAFAKAAEVFAEEGDKAAVKKYCKYSSRILDWLFSEAKPLKAPRNHIYNQGFAKNQKYPRGWMTRFLMIQLWAEILLNSLKLRDTEDIIDSLTEKILKRQIKKPDAESGLWGHFYAYDSCRVSEKAWSHGMPVKTKKDKGIPFGTDMQCTMAHPVFCFTEGLKKLPGSKNAAMWRKAAVEFAENYFKPACMSGPFMILPRGVFGKQGLLWFAGLWHGTNTTYGQAAALAMEFYDLTHDGRYLDIAGANLQWVAGLNAGLTNEAVKKGCVIYTADIPDGRALPVSMIHGIGTRWAGNWTTISGSVCNGFGTGRQFVYDVAPLKKNDAPSALHDEDWITHSGGFLMGLARWAKAGKKHKKV